jgi:hypothetical protein
LTTLPDGNLRQAQEAGRGRRRQAWRTNRPGLDKAAGLADAKTKGKHSDQIDKGVTAAKNALDKLDNKNDDIPDEPPPAAPRTP